MLNYRYSKEGREGWDPSVGQGNKGILNLNCIHLQLFSDVDPDWLYPDPDPDPQNLMNAEPGQWNLQIFKTSLNLKLKCQKNF